MTEAELMSLPSLLTNSLSQHMMVLHMRWFSILSFATCYQKSQRTFEGGAAKQMDYKRLGHIVDLLLRVRSSI